MTLARAAFAFPIALASSAAMAQADPQIDYDAGDYVYSQPVESVGQAPIVIDVDDGDEPVSGAARVIPDRRAPVFIASETVQPTGAAPAYVYADGAALPNAVGSERVLYVYPTPGDAYRSYSSVPVQSRPGTSYPGNGATRVIYRDRPIAAAADPRTYSYGYADTSPRVPAGSRLVNFDRNVWLGECRARLATYDTEGERRSALGLDPALPARGDACATYLDDYVARAEAGALQAQPRYGEEYMLVPVTVMVPYAPRAQD